MEKFKTLSKIFNILFPLRDSLYIFQLNEYKVSQYIKYVFKLLTKRNTEQHDILNITQYVKILGSTTLVLIAIIIILLFFYISNYWLFGLAIFILLQVFTPFLIILASILLKPFYLIKAQHSKEIAKAKILALQEKGLQVIAITGSYGKTTTKNMVYQFLKDTYHVQYTPGNINTAIGISNWINKDLNNNTEILIVEMGAYVKGEIKESVNICTPQISVITTIGKQHLERFKTFDNIINAKLEIFDFAPEKTLRICPLSLKEILPPRNYEINFINTKEFEYKDLDIVNPAVKFNLAIAYNIAISLNINPSIIKSVITKLEIPDRRGDIKSLNGFEFIDNTYNISLDTATESINAAKQIAKRKNKELILITAGIPEGGKEENTLNKEYSKKLLENEFDIIFLNTNLKKYYHEIETQSADSLKDALEKIAKEKSPDKYIILAQPELNDLYYL